ncbi:MAG: hypothetical protein PF569_00810 [Candidatus Woesearchaeota archaeon]|jgi:hypothetical protein|nr:hypothetical protein [Candidatus Woesearchaeota archaeon]
MVLARELIKRITIFMTILFSVSLVYAAPNVIDVTFNEYAYEEVLYNPSQSGGGLYFDSGENQSLYAINGSIIVTNTHPSEAISDVLLNITTIADIYNVVNSDGKLGYVAEFNLVSDYMMLLVPDLGPGDNATFSYYVNVSNVVPPMNFTTSYSDSRIFGGLPLTVSDNVVNNLNGVSYPNSCIFNINIAQNAMTANNSGVLMNFTYDDTTMTGTDAGNATFTADNRTINWNLWAGSCFNSTNATDISYDVKTPAVSVASDYAFINSTMSYEANFTFSRVNLDSVSSVLNLALNFEKFLNNTLTGDNATWRISSEVINPTNISVNLTEVSLWVSVRDGTGTGFTNPGFRDNDTVTGTDLLKIYNPNVLLNNTILPWNNTGSEWYFNYTFSSSPVVWMDIENNIINDGIQIINRTVSYGENQIYIKEIYLATGYWLQINKNITRLSDDTYNIYIQVVNLGTSPTPTDQVVQVYNFLPDTFNLTSGFVYQTSSWYTTTDANETLSDPDYTGTMFQYGIVPETNPYNSSLDLYGGSVHINNSWSVTFNVTGIGEYNFDDLFLTGVDPLNVEGYGSTLALIVESSYESLSANLEYVLSGLAVIVGALVLFL